MWFLPPNRERVLGTKCASRLKRVRGKEREIDRDGVETEVY